MKHTQKRSHSALERILQSQGWGTRRECRALVRAGRVQIEDAVCEDPFVELNADGLVLTVDGKPWPVHPVAYLMLNKPGGYECSQRPLHHSSVFELLPLPLVQRGVQSVGRLDEDTSGLLLFSDDGNFIHRMASPKWKVPKVYRVTTKHPVDAVQLAALQNGVQLHDEPVPIAALGCKPLDSHRLELTLAEGKYHQVKRMVAAAGNRVEALARIAIGGLQLPDDLPLGGWRWLTPEDRVALGVQIS